MMRILNSSPRNLRRYGKKKRGPARDTKYNIGKTICYDYSKPGHNKSECLEQTEEKE